MSSFQVEDGVLDIAAFELWRYRSRCSQMRPAALPGNETQAEVDKLTAMGQELALLNAAAVAGRYCELPNCAAAQAYQWQPSFVMASTVQKYKAIRCLSYQCSEDPVYESEPFNELEAVGHMLASDIVSRLSRYDAAEWGFERPSSVPVLLFGGER